jgi:adenine-specific DNA-methyltransferase
MDKIKNLGQVYTPDNIVKIMFELSKRKGDILEPSAGDGAFTKWIKENSKRNITSIEIDPDNNQLDFIIMDFFDYDINKKYSTIIGNPPYVSFNSISKDTLSKIQSIPYISSYDNRTNLYIYFIRKCVEHLQDNGELILITPREFIKATSSIKLNNFLYESGTITDWYEYGDKMIFKGYSPTVVIWRFEKNNFTRKTNTKNGLKKFKLNDGQISFTSNDNTIKFSDLFFVKVGAVSGMDDVFTNENGNQSFVCSFTKKTGRLKKMFYNIKSPELYPFKEKLKQRKMKKFNEDNWWKWGRGLYESDINRIYVNCKTRDNKPFFLNECKFYDGSVLAIFPKFDIDLERATELLNKVDWDELGFKVGGRFCFSQKSLENVYLPDCFEYVKLFGKY